MSYWIEVHCDLRSEVSDPSRSNLHNGAICWALSDGHPGVLVVDPRYGLAEVARLAKAQGYVRRRITGNGSPYLGWACPHCQKFPPSIASERSEESSPRQVSQLIRDEQ